MQLKTLKDINVQNKTILYRAPYDIATEKNQNGELEVTDESRIACTIPTLKYLMDQNCKIVILTWVKRPDGVDLTLTTQPHAKCLEKLLGEKVEYINECVGEKVQEKIAQMQGGQILMLENVRFHAEEYVDNDAFAQELIKGSDLIVFDAFPQAHRVHSSTTGILRNLESVAGLYFEKEYNSLAQILENPQHPFTAIIGGAKVSDKIEAVKNLLGIADIILVGGGLANAFLKAEGKDMGSSYIEDNFVDEAKGEKKDWILYAKQILEEAEKYHVDNFQVSADIKLTKVLLPYDLVAGRSMKDNSQTELTVAYEHTQVIKNGFGAYDIGPITAKTFSEIISQSKTVFWAGPMGVFENVSYANGTKKIVEAMNELYEEENIQQAVDSSRGRAFGTAPLTIAAGGDTITALNKLGDPNKITHISLAGGATLDFLAGKEFGVLRYLRK